MNEKSVCVLYVVNGGRYGLEYSWDMNERCHILGGLDGQLITITPGEGTVDPFQRVSCMVTFNPNRAVSLKGCQLELKVCQLACACTLCKLLIQYIHTVHTHVYIRTH